MNLADRFRHPDRQAREAQSEQRRADIVRSLAADRTPEAIANRLRDALAGRLPWIATLTPAELRIVRSHGLRPIATVTSTCWLHVGWSWTEGHAEGWHTALSRLRREAIEAGANAVLDVKLRTLPLASGESTDFSLVGTAVSAEGLAPSTEPIVATLPTLEFVKLLEADIVPTGIAVGACYDWLPDPTRSARRTMTGNTEATALTRFWAENRRRAQARLVTDARGHGNTVLAHVDFGQLIEVEGDENQPRRYLGRHIVVGTTVDAPPGTAFPHAVTPAIDLGSGLSPLLGRTTHHQSYAGTERDGAI